jgi:hypothetical protein
MDFKNEIQDLKTKFPVVLEEYEGGVCMTGVDLMDHLLKFGSTSQQEEIKDIDLDKTYKVSKKLVREINVERRIKQYIKEKRSREFILKWLIKVADANKHLAKYIVNGKS